MEKEDKMLNLLRHRKVVHFVTLWPHFSVQHGHSLNKKGITENNDPIRLAGNSNAHLCFVSGTVQFILFHFHQRWTLHFSFSKVNQTQGNKQAHEAVGLWSLYVCLSMIDTLSVAPSVSEWLFFLGRGGFLKI